MFRFEMSQAGSVTEKEREGEKVERGRNKAGQGVGLQKVVERDFQIFFFLRYPSSDN